MQVKYQIFEIITNLLQKYCNHVKSDLLLRRVAAQTFDISDVKYVYSIQYTISWKLDKLGRYKLGAGSWAPSGAGYRLARSWIQYSVYNKLDKLELRQRLEKTHENFSCESLFGRRLPSFNHTNFWLAPRSWIWLKIGNT